jgi:Bacteriophage HK97-gp10, putative tail-component
VIGLNVRVLGTKVLSNVLKSTAATTDQKAQRKVSYWAHVLEAKIKSRAPVVTGDYRRSWNTQMRGMSAIVGTNKPQARRLEYGFVGTDSLDRRYNQAPQPHVRPSIDEVRDPYLRDMATVVRR